MALDWAHAPPNQRTTMRHVSNFTWEQMKHSTAEHLASRVWLGGGHALHPLPECDPSDRARALLAASLVAPAGSRVPAQR